MHATPIKFFKKKIFFCIPSSRHPLHLLSDVHNPAGIGYHGQLGAYQDGVSCNGYVGNVYLGYNSQYCFTPTKVNGPTPSRFDTSWNYNIVEVAITGSQYSTYSTSYDYYQSCALRGDGTVWCWGYNGNGNLGDGTTNTRSYALRVANLQNIRSIFSQEFFSGGSPYNTMFALENSNTTLWAWGYNGAYNLGIYQSDAMLAPVAVQGLRFTQEISM